ncbi:hypothetical protein HHI36_006899 [Cryptolaemus montrouzieri]|uniref:Fringe-like glycosyltransferase domain-containing protein n=1 Tax=Cryptolaemus montrouzieri TaxID=559131 RepID=A0ABD2MN20_9CUCU
MSGNGEQVIFISESVKMSYRNRRLLQTLTVAVLLAYSILLVYQNFSHEEIHNGNVLLESTEKPESVPIRLERHMAQDEYSGVDLQNVELPSEPSFNTGEVTQVTMRPFATELSDLFISVKTTKHFHRERLPIILKTWFQLAKEHREYRETTVKLCILIDTPLKGDSTLTTTTEIKIKTDSRVSEIFDHFFRNKNQQIDPAPISPCKVELRHDIRSSTNAAL